MLLAQWLIKVWKLHLAAWHSCIALKQIKVLSQKFRTSLTFILSPQHFFWTLDGCKAQIVSHGAVWVWDNTFQAFQVVLHIERLHPSPDRGRETCVIWSGWAVERLCCAVGDSKCPGTWPRIPEREIFRKALKWQVPVTTALLNQQDPVKIPPSSPAQALYFADFFSTSFSRL